MLNRTNAIPLTRCSHLLPVVDLVRRLGGPVSAYARRAGLPVNRLEDPHLLVPAHRLWDFYSLVARAESIPDLGAIAMRRTGFSRVFQVIGDEVLRAPSLLRRLTSLRDQLGRETSNLRLVLRSQESAVFLTALRYSLPAHAEWQADLLSLALFTEVVRSTLPTWVPARVAVRSAETRGRRRTLEAMGCQAIEFRCDGPGVSIPRSILSSSIGGTAVRSISWASETQRAPGSSSVPVASTLPIASTAPASSVARCLPPATDFAGSLRQIVEAYRKDGWLTITQAAEIARMSVRSLQYRLAEEATTYSQVVEEARMQLAAAALASTDQRLIEIASDLGFSTHANFSRAFQRWAGVSPSEFRLRRAYREPLGRPVREPAVAEIPMASVASLG